MDKYVLRFERGGVFEVRFLEDAAPATVAAFKAALPLSGGCLQARFAGDEFFFSAPSIEVAEENAVAPYHGAIAFNSDPQWRAVCVYYGSTIKGTYYSLFAEIKENLDELREVGMRVWKRGEEKVFFEKIQ
ncbi:MAG: DUF3830 family protein [Clostridiales Family XIII bacterium]|jgi:hypothetical protein|nr:DUF3830 family protein [Clostridiales Family XIII bacterium]